MKKALINSLSKKLRQIPASLKGLNLDAVPAKVRTIGAAAVLLLALTLVLTTCSREEPEAGPADAAVETRIPETEPTALPVVTEPQPVGLPATMGTVTADTLSICKDAGVEIDVDDYYAEGDRVEIHETRDVEGTLWGYTGNGWILMDGIRMDDVPPGGGEATNFDGIGIVSDGSYAILGYGVVDIKSLNVRVGPGTDYTKIREIPQGNRYAYYEVSDEWVRIGDGWISTQYFYVEGTTAEDVTEGIVTTDALNIRTGPGTSFRSVGRYMENDTVQILGVVNGWGYTEEGWISMIYVEEPEPEYTTGSATVTIGLNIREEPDPDSERIDAYEKGDRVFINEVIDGWGRTDMGWINLDYVMYDE